MTTYHIDVEDENGKALASASGNLEVVSYIAKQVAKDIDTSEGDISLLLTETDGIAGAPLREVVRVTAGADIVRDVLKSRLANERKAATKTPARDEPRSVPLDVVASPDEESGENVPAAGY